jgi:hypothetical protein
MSKEALIRRIKEKAKQDEKNRRDRRFLEAMGFLVAKGFLKTNLEMQMLPNKRLRLEDVIWAGENVEPRILEVLPAAVLRLGKHFDLDATTHQELAEVVDNLRRREETGKSFCGIPYEKVRVWADFPLLDKRVKPLTKRKVVKTFRLDPEAVEKLRRVAQQKGCSETEVLETLLLTS